jgi:nucleoside-diphosphate-sugar epimerase
MIREMTAISTPVHYRELPQDDPPRRRPAIERAVRTLGWRPVVDLAEGLGHTIDWFRSRSGAPREAGVTVAG